MEEEYYGKFDAEKAKRDAEIVRDHYNADAQKEWERFDGRARIEFEINKRFLARYIEPGDRVLDCGGGPGRYSLWLAERGCDVTLFDLAEENVRFGLRKAEELGLKLRGVVGDAREVANLVEGEFDHVLLMGPLYHLTDERDRRRAVESCLSVLKTGGTLSAAFISLYGGMVYALRELITDRAPETLELLGRDFEMLEAREPFCGDGFTRSYMGYADENERFMRSFPLEKLHFLGSEGVLAPFAYNVLDSSDEMYNRLLDLAERLCEREELLSFAEHFLYIGRKIG